MATSTTSRAPLDSSKNSGGRIRSATKIVLVVAIGLLLLGAGTLIGLRFARAGVLPGVEVDGLAVGGLNHEQLDERITSLAERRTAAEIVARLDDETVTASAGELGYTMDVSATAEAAWYRGRQGNPVTALADQLRAFGGRIEVEAEQSVDDAVLTAWSEETAEALEREPREGGLRFSGADVRRRDPRPGAVVEPEPLAEQTRDVILAGDGGTIEVEAEAISPATTDADVDAVLERAERAVASPFTFRRSGAVATLSPEDIGGVLRTRLNDEDEIVLRAHRQRLRNAFGQEAISSFEQDPQSARFEVGGGSVNLVEGRNGFTYNDAKAARQLVEVTTADGGAREAQLDGDVEKPDLTTAQARDLDVVEKVSEFTTNHACCESRVTNIQRIADMVDDVLIKPGETFSVNGFVGERTEDKGFVGGGAIYEGEFVEQVGGGVSQFATTAYNAVYFGGYEIVEHKPHSYYISRYPEGREATLNYPNVDLKIRNNSPHGLVLDTSYTGTSITVAVYGKKWVEVESETGPRRNFTEPETIYRENDELKKGRERVIQEAGPDGFDVTVTRILKFPDGETKREEVTTTYQAQARIVERNS